jgi:hypothetical protein
MARVKARIRGEHYKVEMEGGGHTIVNDEPITRATSGPPDRLPPAASFAGRLPVHLGQDRRALKQSNQN